MKRVVAMLVAAVVPAACNPKPPAHVPASTPAPTGSSSGVPPLHITASGTAGHPIVITGQERNRRDYRLVAASFRGSKASTTEGTFSQAELTFYDKNGSTLQARAPVARIDERHAEVILSGGVVAVSSTGQHLRCDTLTYNRTTARLHGQGHVQVISVTNGTRTRAWGDQFESDINLNDLTMR